MRLQESLSYKKLKVWQKAHQNPLRVIELYRNSNGRKFENIFKQFINAITSVGANIAEGSGDFKRREFIRFLNIALRSAFEVDNWINLIKDGKILGTDNTSILDVIKTENEQIIKNAN